VDGERGKVVLDHAIEIVVQLLAVSLPSLITGIFMKKYQEKKEREKKKYDIKRHPIYERIAYYDTIGIRIMASGKEGLRDFYMKKYADVVLQIFRSRLNKLVETMESGKEVHLPTAFIEMIDAIKLEVQRSSIPQLFYSKIFVKESARWKLVYDEVANIQRTDQFDYYEKVLLFFGSAALCFGNTMSGLELLCQNLNGELDFEIARLESENKGALPDMGERLKENKGGSNG